MPLSPATIEVFAADLQNAWTADQRHPESGGVWMRTTLQRHAEYTAQFEAARAEFARLSPDRQRSLSDRLDRLCDAQRRREISGTDGYAEAMRSFQHDGVPSLVGLFRHDREFLAEEFAPVQQRRAA